MASSKAMNLLGPRLRVRIQKCSYLTKIITCVGIALGEPINVRVGKIVAGLEPENTNLFLQALGRVAADDMVDSDQAVSRTLNDEQAGEGPPARKDGGGGGKSEEGGKNAEPDDNEAALERERQQRNKQKGRRVRGGDKSRNKKPRQIADERRKGVREKKKADKGNANRNKSDKTKEKVEEAEEEN